MYTYFVAYTQGVHWMDLMSNSVGSESISVLGENERKRLEAVWELFQSETVFLIDHLMVLKHVRIMSCLLLKKEKKQKISHIFAQTTHVALPPPKLSCEMGSRLS